MTDPLIRDISDTARWVAAYRARETEREDAAFRDPYARALAGERIAETFPNKNAEWSIIARTFAFDRLLTKQLETGGVDMVVNLAAGLDTRPYRLDLSPSLRWIEVDLPDILDYKATILSSAQPACMLERIPTDLSNHDARRGLFRDLARRTSNAVVITEGLVMYLMPDEVATLARDLADHPVFTRWMLDIMSPGLVAMLNEQAGDLLRPAGSPLLFAPAAGPAFFESCGWRVLKVRSLLKTAASIERLPFFLRMMAMLPESQPAGSRPWSGACLLGRP